MAERNRLVVPLVETSPKWLLDLISEWPDITPRTLYGGMNWAEYRVARYLFALGWEVLNRGWPDFLCRHTKTGNFMAVEVKTGPATIDRSQREMILGLREAGLPVALMWEEEAEMGFEVTQLRQGRPIEGVNLVPYPLRKQLEKEDGAW
jgi:hypothetical protein